MFVNGERIDAKVAKPVPLYWIYVTAWANVDGVVHFRNDIYGLDGLEQYAAADRHGAVGRSSGIAQAIPPLLRIPGRH